MDDIEFGDVQEAKPEVSLRPDRNAHYVVANYEQPKEGEIPVFLDLDVMLDMEAHAASDKSVELGGVLLGGQFHDEEGKPFVVITDSLRAKHYESTKGSFKFTKEAWTEITKERNEYPDDLQMVGWYHTHPDWGVFLSGMDMFICDNFFNRPLDMAYVIDPCRGDRAFFQWTNNPRDRCQRQRGFFVMASRYRAAELAAAVTVLQGGNAMPVDTRMSGYAGAPVINVSQPPQSPQQNLAVLGMLTIQVCLLALLAFRLLAPPATSEAETELAKIADKLEQIAEREDAARTQQAVVKALDQALASSGDMPPGMFEKLTALQQKTDELETKNALSDQYAAHLAEQRQKLALEAKLTKEQLERTITDLRSEKKRLLSDKESLAEEVAKYKPKPKDKKTDKQLADADYTWYWIGGIALGLVALGGIFATLAYRPNRPDLVADGDQPPGSAGEGRAKPDQQTIESRS